MQTKKRISWDEPRATDSASMMPTVTQFHQTGDSFLVRITNNCEVYILGLCKQKREFKHCPSFANKSSSFCWALRNCTRTTHWLDSGINSAANILIHITLKSKLQNCLYFH